MADKKISYKISIDGEAEYKRALQSLNSELKTLGTESNKLSALFSGEANTYDALIAKSKNYSEQQDALSKKLEKLKDVLKLTNDSLAAHKDRTEELRAAQQKAQSAYDNAEKKTEELTTALRKANSEYKLNQEQIQYCERRIQTYSQQINATETDIVLLNREIDKNSGYLREAATSADGTAHSIDRYGKEVKDAAEDTKSFANAADLLAQAIVASGAIEGAEKLKDAIVATAKASIEYESAFAGVRKTVDGTAEELAEISDGIKEMALEIPMASKELAGIAENAGQLGIETGNILKFTDVTAKLAATTDLSANDAAVSISKLGNITKLTADEYSNFGSALVALGNKTSAFESEILAMAIRLASAGDIVGATNSQLLGIASTLVSVGIEAEAGGTAFSKLLRKIEVAVQTGSKKVQEYATVAGMSVEEFSSAWKNDAVGAVTAFIEGLGSLESKGQSSIVVLNEMGLTEQRLLDTISRLSEAEGMLSNNIALSNTAWEENTALAEEAAVRFETTESKLQLLNNSFENLKITVGDELVGKFGGAIDGLTDLTKVADAFVKSNPEVITGITAVASGIGGLAVAGTVTPLVSTLFKTITANPITTAIGLVMSLGSAFATLAIEASGTIKSFQDQAKAAEELTRKGEGLKKTFAEAYNEINNEADSLEDAILKVEQLGGKTDLTAQETVILQGAMNKLNGAIPGLKLSCDDLGTSLDATAVKLRLLAQISEKSAESAAIGTQIQELTKHRQELNDSIKETADDLDKARKYLEEISEGGIQTFDNGAFDLIGTIQDNVNLAVNTMFGYVGDADKAVKDLEKNLEGLKNQLGSTDLAIDDLTKNKSEVDEYISDASAEAQAALDSLKNAAERAEEAAQTTGDTVEKSSGKIVASSKSTKESVDEAGQAIIDHAKTVQSNLDALTKEYDSVYQSAKSSLGGIGGLFGEVAFNTDKSISDMISGMQTQADYFTGYMLNLQRAAQIGIDEGLVAALADGSDESAGYLQKIINEFNQLSDKYGENSTEAQDFITDFNESFEASSAAKDALARTMAGIATDFETRKGEILGQAQELISELEGYSGNAYDEVAAAVTATVGNVSDTLSRMETAISESSVRAGAAMQTLRETLDAKLDGTEEKGEEAGANYTAGLAKGIQEGMPVVTMAVQKLVDESIIGAVNQGLEIRSPSRVGMEQGEFYDEGIAVGIERNTGTVTNAALRMIDKLESSSRSAASAAGANLGNIMAQSMADALAAGRALSQAVASGTLTVDGKVVQSAASVGIPSLTGQAAQDWNAEQKRDFGLPDDWTNQDIVDWLNAGGAMSGGNSSTQQAIDSAIKNESSGQATIVTVSHLGNKGADGKTWGYGSSQHYNPNLSETGVGKSQITVNQNFYGTQSEYQVKKASEEGVKNAVYY